MHEVCVNKYVSHFFHKSLTCRRPFWTICGSWVCHVKCLITDKQVKLRSNVTHMRPTSGKFTYTFFVYPFRAHNPGHVTRRVFYLPYHLDNLNRYSRSKGLFFQGQKQFSHNGYDFQQVPGVVFNDNKTCKRQYSLHNACSSVQNCPTLQSSTRSVNSAVQRGQLEHNRNDLTR